jgi:hypothetical protein
MTHTTRRVSGGGGFAVSEKAAGLSRAREEDRS